MIKRCIIYLILSKDDKALHSILKKARGRIIEIYCYDEAPCPDKKNRSIKMTSQNTTEYVDLKQAADYLIKLFEKTDKIYSCTRTKIGKLLSIVALYYARRNVIIFAEKIRKYAGCGTAINELKGIVDSNVYLTDENNDKKECITKNLLGLPIDSPLHSSSNNVGRVIREAFMRFGAYPAAEIGSLINEVIECIEKGMSDGDIVPLERFSETPLHECALFDFLNDDSVLNED